MLEGYKGAYNSNEESIKNMSKRLNMVVVFGMLYVSAITSVRVQATL